MDNKEWKENQNLVSPSESSEEKPSTCKKLLADFFDMVRFTALLLVIYYVLTLFLFQLNTVDGLSMYPTMENGDRIFVNKLSVFIGSDLHRGDIITVKGEKIPSGLIDKDIIKRIVGIPGDHVQIQDGVLIVNGQKVNEPYLSIEPQTFSVNPTYMDVVLGKDEYYVLGDNRLHSADSRFFGIVPRTAIMGIVLFRFYPFARIGIVQ